MTAPILSGQEAERVLERLAELAELARLARTPAEPSERGGDTDSTTDEGNDDADA